MSKIGSPCGQEVNVRTWLTNGAVAWEIPDGGKCSIAFYYRKGLHHYRRAIVAAYAAK